MICQRCGADLAPEFANRHSCGFRTCDLFDNIPTPWMTELADRARTMERAAIVAWLRAMVALATDWRSRPFFAMVDSETAIVKAANAIERGDHLK